MKFHQFVLISAFTFYFFSENYAMKLQNRSTSKSRPRRKQTSNSVYCLITCRHPVFRKSLTRFRWKLICSMNSLSKGVVIKMRGTCHLPSRKSTTIKCARNNKWKDAKRVRKAIATNRCIGTRKKKAAR